MMGAKPSVPNVDPSLPTPPVLIPNRPTGKLSWCAAFPAGVKTIVLHVIGGSGEAKDEPFVDLIRVANLQCR